jgi:hypothetical protein
MFSKKVLLFLFVGVFVFAGWAIAQEPLPPPVAKPRPTTTKPIEFFSLKGLTQDERFSSIEGRFSIALPKAGAGYTPMTLESTGGQAFGGAYIWLVREGSITVIYGDLIKLNANLVTEKDYADFFRGLKEGMLAATKGKITSEQETQLQGWHGRKFTLLLPDGRNQVIRAYAEKRRSYQLIAMGKNNVPDAETLLIKVLDSFSILPPEKGQ